MAAICANAEQANGTIINKKTKNGARFIIVLLYYTNSVFLLRIESIAGFYFIGMPVGYSE